MQTNNPYIREELEQISERLRSLLSQEEQYLTIDGAAAFLKVARSRLYKFTMYKEIPYIKKGGILRFRKSDLVAWLESGSQPPIVI